MTQLMHIRGTRIYMEQLGQEHEEALLYFHGGPGDKVIYEAPYDPICCAEQTRVFRDVTPNGKIVNFDNSGHFPRIEEPEKYTDEVLKFILE